MTSSIKYYLPFYVYMAIVFVISMLANPEYKPNCIVVSEQNLGYINLAIFCYAMPFMAFILGIYAIHLGVSVNKYKTNPPPNLSAMYASNPKPVKCPLCILFGTLALFLFVAYLVYFGHNIYTEICKGQNIYSVVSEITLQC